MELDVHDGRRERPKGSSLSGALVHPGRLLMGFPAGNASDRLRTFREGCEGSMRLDGLNHANSWTLLGATYREMLNSVLGTGVFNADGGSSMSSIRPAMAHS